ncbi:MAG TPA: hypothetical protein VKA01_13150 [Vicinamibacteria bacterium]|nr:hypothetical protein [Vicinamibacteria bacterium]
MAGVPSDIQEFVIRNIDSVAQLEALLLLRAGIGEAWRPGTVAERLYIQPKTAADLLRDLHQRELIMLADPEAPAYKYGPTTRELVRLVEELAVTYAKQLIEVTRLIHSKASRNVQGFADAFRLREGP